MIAVALLTCGREELSATTARTFVEHHRRRADMFLLHADCGDRGDVMEFVRLLGFRTVHAPSDRVPQMASFRKLIEESALKGGEFVLWLENDWESVAPIPSLDFLRLTRDELGIMTWRMFGARKMREDGPRAMAGEHRIGTADRVEWQPMNIDGGRWEFGRTHWGAGACIATLDHLQSLTGCYRLKDVITAEPNLPTLRVRDNIMFHIGTETTEGFQG